MGRGRGLQPALELAERREEEAARELARARVALTEAHARLDELVCFRADYHARYARGCRSGRLIKDLQQFLDRLDGGIQLAESQVSERERRCERCQREWLRRRARTRAIDKLIERRQFEEAAAMLRAEQHELDELALRRAGGGRAG